MLGVRKVDVVWAGDSGQETISQKEKVPVQGMRGIGVLTKKGARLPPPQREPCCLPGGRGLGM